MVIPDKFSRLLKTHKDLLILLAFPVGVLLLLLLAVYIPRLLANPQHDFIYSVCEDYCSSRDGGYQVDSAGRIEQLQPSGASSSYRLTRIPRLYYYDIETDSSRVLSAIEAQRYAVDPSSKSPDGYRLHRTQSSSGGFLLGGYSSSSDWVLRKGLMEKKLELEGSNNYSRDINLVGWVTHE